MATLAGMASVSFTQAGRPFSVTTPLGADKLLLERFSGEEAVSAPFHFTLDMVSRSSNVSADALLRKPISVNIDLPDGGTRVLHGRVSRFVQLGSADGLTSYRADMVPWIWFLSLSSDLRIFQNLSVVDIVKQVFDESGFPDYQVKCVRSYPKREYCVQYRESHLDFVSRLLEEEGIFYFFEHSGSKHTLVLADASSAVKPSITPKVKLAAAGKDNADDDVLERVELETSARTGKVVLADYNPATPSTLLRSEAAGKHAEEVYDYPGNFFVRDEGDRYARIRLEEREAMQVVVRGEGNVRGLQTGAKFDLAGHYRADLNKSYLLLRVWHSGSVGSYHAGSDAEATYRTRFIGIPADVPYHPPRVTPKPRVFGSQTAVVAGKSGEEIDVDKDGRVVVQFHWDRKGAKDEKSSIRVRVSSTWAGKGYGLLQVPRIGQEVIVDFLEGDPDRPIITGRVFNAEQVPPCDPSGKGGVLSGFRSKTHKGSGYNEMTLDDTAGDEKITIHAQYNMDTVVEHDQSNTVRNNRMTTVAVDDTESVGAKQTITVGADQIVDVAANRTTTVGANANLTVGGAATLEVTGARATTVGGNDTLDVTGDRSATAGGQMTLHATGDLGATSDANITVGASANVKVEGAKITLSAGGSTVEIGPAGVKITTSALVEVQGTTIKLN